MNKLVSPRDLAQAIGMSESSLKRWADRGLLKVTRTAGGHRRISIKDALSFVRNKRLNILAPDAIGLPARNALLDLDDTSFNDSLLEHLVAGNKEDVWQMLIGRYLEGASIAELGDGPIKSALKEIGAKWGHESDAIFVEHRATDLCLQIVQQMRLLATTDKKLFRATGGAIQDDPYLLPSMLVASIIVENGGDATNLGPNTPIDVLRIDSIQRPPESRPELVWISASIINDPASISDEIASFAEECLEAGIQVAVGGRDVDQLSLKEKPNLSIHSTLSGFDRQARELASSV
ncbi:MAG: hypothetical protein CMJ40_06300 [Phycisphaerae bacterium]|mgnify:CR=1 FL=1|nr:hypothetical protein [Phycisphaerae bacterium]